MKFLDLTGRVFGKLTVLSFNGVRQESSRVSRAWWNCKCTCGAVVPVRSNNLTREVSTSCSYTCGRPPSEAAAEKRVFQTYKDCARRRGIVFQLTACECGYLFRRNCFYCGYPPSNVSRNRNDKTVTFVYNGIDRLDNNNGYTVNNAVPCCVVCNRAKSLQSIDEFVERCKLIVDRHKERTLGLEADNG